MGQVGEDGIYIDAETCEKIGGRLLDTGECVVKDFDDVKRLLGLKKTKFVVDPELLNSTCDTSSEEEIICYLTEPKYAIHEGVHAFFDERGRRLWDTLGEEKYKQNISNIVTDRHLEEITARVIETNYNKRELRACDKDTSDVVDFTSRSHSYADKELGEKITRLSSIYDYYCVMPQDMELYNKLKKKLDPIDVYNEAAEHVGADKLIP